MYFSICSTVLATEYTLNKFPFRDWLMRTFISMPSRVLLESQCGFFCAVASSNLFKPLMVHWQSDSSLWSESIADSNCFKIYQLLCTPCVQCVAKLIIFLLRVLGGNTKFGKTFPTVFHLLPSMWKQKQQFYYWRIYTAPPRAGLCTSIQCPSVAPEPDLPRR